MKHELFSRNVRRTIFFFSESTYPGDTPYQVWFDLNNFLTRLKRAILKFLFRENQSSVWNIKFFPSQAILKILFLLNSNYTGDIPCRFLFDLNNTVTRWKGPIFKNPFREIQEVSYEILTFFLGKLYQKFFLFNILITLVILHAEFCLIWTTPWPDEKDLFLKFLFREIQKVSHEILTFFLGKLYQKLFWFYILNTLVINHAEFRLIWTHPWPDKISIFLKIE